jgi:hypothetical protein
VCVAIALAIAACDSGTPTATLVEGNARWLHDRVTVTIDQRIDFDRYGGTVLSSGDVRVASERSLSWSDDETYTGVTVSHGLEVSGPFRLVVYAAIAPDSFEWELPTWTVDEPQPADAPEEERPTGAPQVAVLLAPESPFRDERQEIVVLWPTESGLRAMARTPSGAWRDLGALRDELGVPVTFSGTVRLAVDDYGQAFAAWGTNGFAVYAGDAYGYAAWDSIGRPSVGEDPSLAASPFSTVALAGVRDGAVAIARGVPTEEGPEWTTATLPVTSIVGRPAIALVGYEDTPFVAYVDATAEGTKLRVAAWYEGQWTTLGEADVASPIGDPAVATHGDSVVVTWNDGGTIAAAKVGFAGSRVLPSPGTAESSPDIAGARLGSVAVSLIDGDVASTLRWDGESWIPLGDPWIDGGGTPSGASTAVWSGRVPITAWLDEGTVRVALYNGEAW